MKGTTLMSTETVDERFVKSFDQMVGARVLVLKIDSAVTSILAHSEPVLALMNLGRVSKDRALMRDIEIGINMARSGKELSHKAMKVSESSAKECSSILSQLDMCGTNTTQTRINELHESFENSIWNLNESIGDVRALHAQIEGVVASLEEMLPI